MMLRTTISTIRKVCTLGFVQPRVLRDDFCNGPATYAVIRKAHKSTKSTDDGPDPTEKGTGFPILKTTSPDTTTGIPLTHREKCQKIIEQAFGTSPAEPVKEQYCSHTVNIEATRREIKEAENEREKLQEQYLKEENPMIPDDRQYGIFKMSRELIKVDDDVDEIMVEENTKKEALSTDTLSKKETAPQTLAVNKHLVKIFDVASPEEPHLKTDGFSEIQEPKLDCAKEDSDTAGNKAELCDDDDADAETLSTVDRLGNVRNPAENLNHKRVLNFTTAKEQEEKLAQKLETIEETPLVEAQKPGIEGFNVNPKVLGDQLNPTLTCKSIHKKQDKPQEENHPGDYDEVAKRCLSHPLGQIDDMLVKEMEKIGLPLTSNPEEKTPFTLMGDEQQIQMDIFNINKQQEHEEIYPKSAESEDNDEERGSMFMTSPSCHMFSQVRLPDLNEQAEEKTFLKSEDIEPGEKEDSVSKHPDQIKNKIKPVSCDNNATAKVPCFQRSELEEDEEEMKRDHDISSSQFIHMSQTIRKDMNPTVHKHNSTAKLLCFRTSELEEDKEEMERYHDISPSQLHIRQTIQKDMNPTIHKDEKPQFGCSEPNVQLPAPNVLTPTDKESMQALHSSIYKQLTGRYDKNDNVRDTEAENRTPHAAKAFKQLTERYHKNVVENTKAKNRTPDTAEVIKPAINHPTELSSYHPVGVGTGNIEDKRLTHYGIINASDLAENDQRQLPEKEVQKKNSHSRYLSSTCAWGQDKDPSATKVRNENELYVKESEEVECHSRTPEFQTKTIELQPNTIEFQPKTIELQTKRIELQTKTMEEQAVLDERKAANRLVERVPFNKITLPGQKFDRKIENSPNEAKVIDPCSNKLHSDVHSENLEPEKVTLPEELMKEHELDPYYVLTCNETCPISPGSSLSACENTDFVDTTDTIYMKKNICESIRPKSRSENLIVPFEKVMAQRPKVDVKSLMLQYENLTSETKVQINDKINISESEQLKLDGTHLVTPQSENVPADTQAQLHKISEIELIPENTPEITDLPNIKPKVSLENPSLLSSQPVTLTELLKRVRDRSQAQCTSNLGVKVDPTTGKCRRRAPRCVPTAPRSPPLNPIPPPSFGLPMVKRRPEVCMPKKKGDGCSKKCAACDIDVTCGVQLGGICPEIACELDEGELCNAISRVDLTEVVLDHIQMLGKMVGVVLQQVKSNVETLLAREYDPWAPIPSWPLSKKAGNPCDKPCGNWTPGNCDAPPCVRGCPVFPKASTSINPAPPCNLKPCKGFPKRSFSALNCLAVSLGNNEVYDLGQI